MLEAYGLTCEQVLTALHYAALLAAHIQPPFPEPERGERDVRSPGMARKVDELGRVVLPSELRRRFRINEGDYLEISVEDGRIILTKVESGCVFCDSPDQLISYRDKLVCPDCIRALGTTH